jgi:hypothetical protein
MSGLAAKLYVFPLEYEMSKPHVSETKYEKEPCQPTNLRALLTSLCKV